MSNLIPRWAAALLVGVSLLSARTHCYQREQPSPFFPSILVQTGRDLADLQGYWQEAQKQAQAPGVSPAEQRL